MPILVMEMVIVKIQSVRVSRDGQAKIVLLEFARVFVLAMGFGLSHTQIKKA